MNVVRLLLEQARRRPDAPAIIQDRRAGPRQVSFRELEERTGRAAGLLLARGLRAGDRVLVLVPVCLELYEVLIGVLRAGLVAVLPDPSSTRKQFTRAAGLARPKAFVGVPKAHLLRLLSPKIRRIPHKFVVGTPLPGAARWRRALSKAPSAPIADVDDEAPGLLTFTSGTTGEPKVAQRTHGFLRAQLKALELLARTRAGDVELVTLPVFVLADLARGVTSLLPCVDLRRPGRADPGLVAQTIDRHRPVSFVGSPALLERIADHALRRSRTYPSFRDVYVGGAVVHPRLLGAVQAAAPESRVWAVYGSTEAEPIAVLEANELLPEDRRRTREGRGVLAGRIVSSAQLRILREAWGTPLARLTPAELAHRTLAAGKIGEIVVAGPQVLPGYLDGRGDPETKIRVGETVWHRTGDAGWLDEEGRLWLVGRCSAKVEDASGVTWPLAVEAVALEDAGVRRAAFLPVGGRRILVVEPAEGSKPAALESLVGTLGIEEVRRLRRIPVDRRHNAKVDYAALARRLS